MLKRIRRLFGREGSAVAAPDPPPPDPPPPDPAPPDPPPPDPPPPYCIEHDGRVVAALGAEGLEFSRRLEAVQRVEPDGFYEAFDALALATPNESQREYGLMHRRRFYELVNLAAEIVAGLEAPVMLDIGLTEYVRLYKMFIPGLSLHTLEQPNYFNPAGLGVDQPHEADLTRRASRDAASIPKGTFDLIIFAEVLEHLFVNPVEVLEWLLALLKPSGRLLITTPNMFSKIAWPAFLNYDNPLAPFPNEEFRTLGQAHLREYSHIELLRFVEQAGGKSKALFFSACWDDDETLAPIDRHNMILLAAPREAPRAAP